MREIKFRVWDKGRNKFLESGSNVIGNIFYWKDRLTVDTLQDIYFLLQYTGLKDINGKEIYEGDILQDNFGTLGIVYYELFEDAFCQGAFQIDWMDGDLTGFRDVVHLSYKIIGNKFENPELLDLQTIPERQTV